MEDRLRGYQLLGKETKDLAQGSCNDDEMRCKKVLPWYEAVLLLEKNTVFGKEVVNKIHSVRLERTSFLMMANNLSSTPTTKSQHFWRKWNELS